MSNRKDINMKEELLGRHHEVMSKLREVEVIRAYYENELENIEETISCIAEIGSLEETKEAASAHNLKVLEMLNTAPSQIKAMETMAKMTGGTLDLEQASRNIKMAGLSKIPSRNLVSNLRHRAKDSPEWELVDQNTARLLSKSRNQETPEDNMHEEPDSGEAREDHTPDRQDPTGADRQDAWNAQDREPVQDMADNWQEDEQEHEQEHELEPQYQEMEAEAAQLTG